LGTIRSQWAITLYAEPPALQMPLMGHKVDRPLAANPIEQVGVGEE